MKESSIYVSVIVPTYRRDNVLKRALKSLITQSYSHIEMIIVDDNADASWNDKVKKIVDEISTSCKVVYIQNKKNIGSSKTRNVGIRRASGKYITFLDDDDLYLPNKVEKQVEHMIENNSDYSITDLFLYDQSDRLVEKRTRKYIEQTDKESLIRYHLLHHLTGTDTLMFKREYLLKIGGFPPIDIGDEFYLMHRAIEYGGIFSYLPGCDVKAYIHTGTASLSSGDRKINGEKKLYKYKKKHFSMLNTADIRYIKMRHYAVLAFAEMRQKSLFPFFKNLIFSFVISPFDFLKLLLNTR